MRIAFHQTLIQVTFNRAMGNSFPSPKRTRRCHRRHLLGRVLNIFDPSAKLGVVLVVPLKCPRSVPPLRLRPLCEQGVPWRHTRVWFRRLGLWAVFKPISRILTNTKRLFEPLSNTSVTAIAEAKIDGAEGVSTEAGGAVSGDEGARGISILCC